MELDKEVIATEAGEYTVVWEWDEWPDAPSSAGFGMALVGNNRHADVTAGVLGEDILSLVRYHSVGNQDAWHYERRSSAAICRYLQLRYPVLGVVPIDDRFRPDEPSADRDEGYAGFAWEEPQVSGQYDEKIARQNVESDLAAWHAWDEGDVFGYRVFDPQGEEIDSCCGYYGMDREQAYTLSVAKEAIAADVAERTDKANLVGAGIVGLI